MPQWSPAPGVPAFFFLPVVWFADSKNASAAGDRKSKAFRRKHRRRLSLPNSCAVMSPWRTNGLNEPPLSCRCFSKETVPHSNIKTCANKPATRTGLCKNRRNTSLFIKLSGSYKTFRKSVACLFHVKRFQTGHSARKVLFGRGAVACNAQTTPAFHVKRFQTTGRSGQDALFGRVAVGCNAQRTPVFHVKRFAELRHLADTRKCRTLPLFRCTPPPPVFCPNAHAE